MATKKIILFLIPIILLGFYGYSKTASESANPPRVVVEPEVYDFGEISVDEVVHRNFEIKNKGTGKLKIKRVATSCGCTRAKVKEKIIAPKESTTLRVTYEPALMSSHTEGKVKRFVYLQTNDPRNPQVEVTIKAIVK